MRDKTLWAEIGEDKAYQHYQSSDRFKELRDWVDKVYFKDGLSKYLDNSFISQLCNNDFYARIWELKVAEYLGLTGLRLVPTNGLGPDFCIELHDGKKIWIEVVHAKEDQSLRNIKEDAIRTQALYNYPTREMALRYSSSLVTKANKIYEKYLNKSVGEADIVLIAISGVAPGSGLAPEMEHFIRAIMPMGEPVVHVSLGSNLNEARSDQPTYSTEPVVKKSN